MHLISELKICKNLRDITAPPQCTHITGRRFSIRCPPPCLDAFLRPSAPFLRTIRPYHAQKKNKRCAAKVENRSRPKFYFLDTCYSIRYHLPKPYAPFCIGLYGFASTSCDVVNVANVIMLPIPILPIINFHLPYPIEN